MKKTSTELADGRELIYFDETDDATRVLVDPRDLPETATSSQIRYDVVLDEWVSMASHRQGRTHLPPTSDCPLCPSADGRQTEIPSPDYDVVVFENRYPSFATDPLAAAPEDASADLFRQRAGVGRCEVVCFTSDHMTHFAELSPTRVRTVLEAWADRSTHLALLPGVEQVFCFENRGEEIGVTLSHPHGQIYGYPFVTPRTEKMLAAAAAHRECTGRNLFADVLAAEQQAGVRVVTRSDHWTAFVPYAARWPLEVHLYPNRRVLEIAELDEEQRQDFCQVYLDLLRRMDGLYGSPLPYISAWHQAPVRRGRDLAYLHLQVFSIRRAPDKLKYLAGSESAMGAFVNDVRPEQAAAALREVSIG